MRIQSAIILVYGVRSAPNGSIRLRPQSEKAGNPVGKHPAVDPGFSGYLVHLLCRVGTNGAASCPRHVSSYLHRMDNT